MTKTLHVGKPNLLDMYGFLKLAKKIWNSGRLTNDGPVVQEFERTVANILKVKHAVAVTNATTGLQVAAKAMFLSGEVIVPSFTFVGTVGALAWIGLTPVFCDIDPHSLNMDWRKVEDLITEQTTAILGVHLFGRPCVPERLENLAYQHHLRLIFDAAHAFGVTYGGRNIGTFGDCEVFSFHATKFVHSFEGGVITTNNDRVATALRLRRNYGFVRETVTAVAGTNAKMSEIHAAMGLISLKSMNWIRTVNRARYEQYYAELQDVAGISFRETSLQDNGGNYQYIVLDVSQGRDALYDKLQSEGVMARRYFHPGCHRLLPWAEERISLPVTEKMSDRLLCLPTGLNVLPRDVERICNIIRGGW